MKRIWFALMIFLFMYFTYPYGLAANELNERTITVQIQLGIQRDSLGSDGSDPISLGSRSALLNDTNICLLEEPFEFYGTTYVAIRDFSNLFGFDLDYSKDELVSLTVEDKTIILSRYDGGIKFSNNEMAEVNIHYILRNNRAYVPLRFITEELNLEVSFDKNKNLVYIHGELIDSGKTKGPVPTTAKKVIDAVTNTCVKNKYRFEVINNLHDNTTESLVGIHTRRVFENKLELTKTINVENKKYETTHRRTYSSEYFTISQTVNGISVPMKSVGVHYYSNITDMAIQGIKKYYITQCDLIGTNKNMETYQIKSGNKLILITINTNIQLVSLYKELDHNAKLLKEVRFLYN